MITQIFTTVCHVLYNMLFVRYFGLGIKGAAIASFISNLQVLTMNLVLTNRITDLKEALEIEFTDSEVYQDIGEYL